MNIGLILPCRNIEEGINLSNILGLIELFPKVHFCFVNNGSTDNTFSILKYFKKESKNAVSILDIKKTKNDTDVMKAGARFLNSMEDVDYVQFTEVDFRMDFHELKRKIDECLIVNEKDFYEKVVHKVRFSKRKMT